MLTTSHRMLNYNAYTCLVITFNKIHDLKMHKSKWQEEFFLFVLVDWKKKNLGSKTHVYMCLVLRVVKDKLHNRTTIFFYLVLTLWVFYNERSLKLILSHKVISNSNINPLFNSVSKRSQYISLFDS